MLLRPENLPVTRFNAVVSPHRVFETRRFTEAEFAAIGQLVPGATFDDVVMAVCGGALRRYLDAQGELPEGHSLAAIVPEAAATPPAGGDPADAQITPAWRHVPLRTDIADPLQRLVALRAQATAAPDPVSRLLGSRALAEAGEQASAALLAWTRRWVGRASARMGRRAPPANCTISLLGAIGAGDGPDRPLYLCGARLTYFSAILPITDGLGLAFAVTRCDGRVVISPTSCRELMPDPEVFAQCLRDSFQQYLALAAAKPQAVKKRAVKKPAARKAAAPPVAPAVRSARPRASAPGTPRRTSPKA